MFFLPLLLGQYQRVVYSGKGEVHDIAASHPLSYWTAKPLAHDDGGDLCLGCKLSDGRVATDKDYQPKTQIRHLGALAGHDIVQVLYQIHSDVPEVGGTFHWKLLLVGTKAGQYAEIFHLQPSGTQDPLKPARIVDAGKEKILATYDPDGGNGGGCWEGYWWFDAAGPHPVDFGPVYKAIGERAPKDSTYTEGCWTINLDQRQIHTGVQKINPECHACGMLGTATAEFEIVHGVATPTKVEFDSDPQD